MSIEPQRLAEIKELVDSGDYLDGWANDMGEMIDEINRLAAERDQWKERHDRERAAHASNLKEQQKCEARIAELGAALDSCEERSKACDQIADGDEGWQQLRNLCVSTMSVARLRDELERWQGPGNLEAWNEMLGIGEPIHGNKALQVAAAIALLKGERDRLRKALEDIAIAVAALATSKS